MQSRRRQKHFFGERPKFARIVITRPDMTNLVSKCKLLTNKVIGLAPESNRAEKKQTFSSKISPKVDKLSVRIYFKTSKNLNQHMPKNALFFLKKFAKFLEIRSY